MADEGDQRKRPLGPWAVREGFWKGKAILDFRGICLADQAKEEERTYMFSSSHKEHPFADSSLAV